MRKRKGIEWPRIGQSSSKYRHVFQAIGVPKIGSHYDLSFVPKVIRTRYKQQLRKEGFHRVIDHKIFTYKYYPWCYKGDTPTLILQGWYNVELAKSRYIRRYGKHALDNIRFIQGREAIERGFQIGKSLLIEGKWRTIMNKTLRPLKKNSIVSRDLNTEVIQKTRGRGKYEEKKMMKVLKRQEYGERKRRYIPEVTFKKRVILQKIQKANEKRKTDIYEE